MEIRNVTSNKKEYLDLLLLADEQEDMIDNYLERGEMFVLDDDGVKAECVVTKEDDGVYELKNIAVLPQHQHKGYGKRLIEYCFNHYSDCNYMFVGTGDCPSALSFYHSCGFTESHRVKNFFTDNYDHEMFEDGVQLVDMVYLKRGRYMLTTDRLNIFPLTNQEIQTKIEEEADENLKQAYSEMLAGCRKKPDQRIWHTSWAIQLKDSDKVIGDLCFKGLNDNGMVEIGYRINPEYEGNGFMTEAVTAMANWASKQPNVICVEAETEPDNYASQKVLTKSGFLPNGTMGEEGPRYILKYKIG